MKNVSLGLTLGSFETIEAGGGGGVGHNVPPSVFSLVVVQLQPNLA